MRAKPVRIWSLFTFILISIPIIFYYYQTWRHAFNIPFADDYPTALVFLNDFIGSNPVDKLKLLFAQHAEHRVVFTRANALFTYLLLGEVNFSLSIIIGNIGLLLLGLILYRLLPNDANDGKRLFYFIPVVFFLFNLQNWGSTASAYNSLQHFYALLFVFSSLYLLRKDGLGFLILAILLAIAASFTSGNGIFVFTSGMFLLLLFKRFGKDLIIWIGASAIILAIYFHGYSPPLEGNFENLLRHPDNVLGAFFGGLGGFINFERDFDPESLKSFGFLSAILTGIVISVFLQYLIFKRYYSANPIVFCCILFLFLTYGAISISRSQFATVEDISSVSRYKINSIVLFVFCYYVLLELTKNRLRRVVLTIFISFSVLHNIRSYQVHSHSLNNLTLRKLKGSWIWNYYSSDEQLYYHRIQSASILEKAKNKGIFKMPDYIDFYLKKSREIYLDLIDETNNIQYSFEIDNRPDSDYITIFDGWAFIKDESTKDNIIYLALKCELNNYIFNAINSYRQDVTAHFIEESGNFVNYYHSGFTCIIRKRDLEPGLYKVGLLITKGGEAEALQYTENMVDLTSIK